MLLSSPAFWSGFSNIREAWNEAPISERRQKPYRLQQEFARDIASPSLSACKPLGVLFAGTFLSEFASCMRVGMGMVGCLACQSLQIRDQTISGGAPLTGIYPEMNKGTPRLLTCSVFLPVMLFVSDSKYGYCSSGYSAKKIYPNIALVIPSKHRCGGTIFASAPASGIQASNSASEFKYWHSFMLLRPSLLMWTPYRN